VLLLRGREWHSEEELRNLLKAIRDDLYERFAPFRTKQKSDLSDEEVEADIEEQLGLRNGKTQEHKGDDLRGVSARVVDVSAPRVSASLKPAVEHAGPNGIAALAAPALKWRP